MKTKDSNNSSNTEKQRIVIVDDDKTIRDVTKLYLAKSGYEVIEASNGLDGLAASLIHSPDLVISDIMMPKMGGFELLGLFKENPELANIPFIFISGKKIEKTDLRKGMELGADDYLLKPFTNTELLSAVKARLNKKDSLERFYETRMDDITSNIIHALPHEFRSSLKIILGFSQLLIDMHGLPEEEVKELASKIYTSGWKLRHLLENMALYDLLQIWVHDQNKIKELRRDVVPSMMNFIPAIAEKLMIEHDRADALQISIKDFPVQISPVYLTKIIEELIDNALKFSKEGTKVYITSEDHGSDIHIIIRDEGCGMSKEQINKISAFQQFDREFFHQEGAGLGLVITKSLVELYNGSLSIESEEGVRTTIKVTLPKAKSD